MATNKENSTLTWQRIGNGTNSGLCSPINYYPFLHHKEFDMGESIYRFT